MLTRLRITDFAIIDHLEMDFQPGLAILTGETGAGKSIVLDAIQALTGGATDVTMVRSGASKARLEAVIQFDAGHPEIGTVLDREELAEEPGQIVLEREIRLEGRSTARINGHSVSQAILREIGGLLVDIHGQSEHLSLLNTHAHIGLLDRYARNESLLSSYQKVYHHLHTVQKELFELIRLEKEDQARLELIQFQLDEIQSARLVDGEEQELDKERTRLANAENLTSLAHESIALLDEAAPETQSVVDLLGQAVRNLSALARVDSSQAELADAGESLLENCQDLAARVRDYAEQIEFNPRRLEEVEERLDLIHRLSRKYGGSVPAILEHAHKNQIALERISHAGERISALQVEEKELLAGLAILANELTISRMDASTKLAQAVELELRDLRMEGAKFKVDLHSDPAEQGLPIEGKAPVYFDATGADRVEFMIAPNPGEGFKPLVKIASGGETSRLMLAIKNVLAHEDRIPTLIFDEIDQGIGGRVGMVVGRKLWELARYHQVFCVTHLPQLAAYGSTHYSVSKEVYDNRTHTLVNLLEGDLRIKELAQMLGAENSSNLLSARELLKQVHSEIKQIS
jgi:DNA repair protein RecN (Recombination protein N)